MRPFRFVHCADLHLDTPFRGMSDVPVAIRNKLLQSTFEALESIVALSMREQVDFVVIAGDVYDAADRSLRAQIRFQRALQAWSSHGIQVFVIHGNHDPLDGRAAKLAWPDGVYEFSADGPETAAVVSPERGLLAQIHGMSYKTAAVYDNLAERIAANPRESGVYQIGLLHTNVDGDAGHDNYAPSSKRELILSGMDYWALGHIHTRSVLHGGDGSRDTAVVYPGNIQGRSVRECGPKGCYIVDVDDDGGTLVSFHAVDAVRWVIENLNVADLETEQELKDEIEQRIDMLRSGAEGRPVIVRLLLEGRGPAHEWLRAGAFLDELTAELRDAEAAVAEADGAPFVWLESIVDHTGRAIDLNSLREGQSLISDMLGMSEALQADPERLTAFRNEALASLLVNSKAAKWLTVEGAQDEEMQELLKAAEEMLIDALADGGWEG